MIADKDFILAIELYPELYKAYKGDEKVGENNKKALWSQFARDIQFKSGAAAEMKWRQLISKYMTFLMYGTPFPFAREMQFMQMPLLGAGLEDTQCDSDIDETELKQVLNIYEEFPSDIKKEHIRADDCKEVSKKHGQAKGQENESNITNNSSFNSPVSNIEKPEIDILDSNNYTTSNALMKGEQTENKMLSERKKTNTDSMENISTTTVTSSRAQAVNNSSGDANTPGGFTNLTSLELIFLGYAKVLQRMPLRLQLQTKRKIADIMDEAELKLFEGN